MLVLFKGKGCGHCPFIRKNYHSYTGNEPYCSLNGTTTVDGRSLSVHPQTVKWKEERPRNCPFVDGTQITIGATNE